MKAREGLSMSVSARQRSILESRRCTFACDRGFRNGTRTSDLKCCAGQEAGMVEKDGSANFNIVDIE
jgi:hypothetical protein